jgi:hypothetical protein
MRKEAQNSLLGVDRIRFVLRFIHPAKGSNLEKYIGWKEAPLNRFIVDTCQVDTAVPVSLISEGGSRALLVLARLSCAGLLQYSHVERGSICSKRASWMVAFSRKVSAISSFV